MITNFNDFNKKLFYTKESGISGFGNFANVDLKSGTKLGVGLEKIDDTGEPDIDYNRFDICTYTNHSDNPNLFFKKEDNNYYFYTLRDIKKDEELTIDYSKFDFEGERDFI
jgi:SET domain-containing protein